MGRVRNVVPNELCSKTCDAVSIKIYTIIVLIATIAPPVWELKMGSAKTGLASLIYEF